MKTALLLLMLTSSSALLYAGVPIEATVKLFTDENTNDGGLQVLLRQKDYPGVKTKKIEFEILIVNWMLEEVFIEVTNLGEANFSLFGEPIGVSVTFFPDNASLLKRLHAATVSAEGKRSTCACGVANVTLSREIPPEVDLSEFVGRTGTLRFSVSGFYRSNGKKFRQDINLHFNIVAPGKSEQTGADQPATKPADQSSTKDQPSTPTSKDSPR